MYWPNLDSKAIWLVVYIKENVNSCHHLEEFSSKLLKAFLLSTDVAFFFSFVLMLENSLSFIGNRIISSPFPYNTSWLLLEWFVALTPNYQGLPNVSHKCPCNLCGIELPWKISSIENFIQQVHMTFIFKSLLNHPIL